MTSSATRSTALTFCCLLLAVARPNAIAQDTRPAIADPACAFHVEGQVLLTGDRPGVDLVIERATDSTGRQAYSAAFSTRTDSTGHFEFSYDGIGIPPPNEWFLVVRRRTCGNAVSTVRLHEGAVPPHNNPGKVASNLVVRVPHCHIDPPSLATTGSHAQVTSFPPVGRTVSLYYQGRAHEVDVEQIARTARARVIPFLALWRAVVGGASPNALYFDPIGSDGYRPARHESCARVLTGAELTGVTMDVATHDLNFPASSTLGQCYHVHHVAAVDVYAAP